MKKNSIIVVAFLALLASCSKEHLGTETTGNNTYQFETFVGGAKNSTKGMPKMAWKMGDVIALYGLNMSTFKMDVTPDSWTFAKSQNANGNMTPMFCYDPAGVGVWNYGAPVAWYDEVKTSFMAIYPYDAAEIAKIPVTPTMASDVAFGYTVQGGYVDGATPIDINIARSKIKYQTDVMVALTKDQKNTVKSIPLNFRHILSQVRFRVRNSSTTSTDVLRVNDITVSNIPTVGHFAFSGTEDAEAPALGQWTINDATANVRNFKCNLRAENVGAIGANMTVDAVNFDNEALIMLPQTVSDAATVTVSYAVSTNGGGSWSGDSEATFKLKDFKATWEPNRLYTFVASISVASNSISFAPPEVDKWDTSESVNLNN